MDFNSKFEYIVELCKDDDNFLRNVLSDVDLYKLGITYYDFISKFNDNSYYTKELLDILLNRNLIDKDIEKIFNVLCCLDGDLADYFLHRLKNKTSILYSKLITGICHSSKREILYENIDLFLGYDVNPIQLYNLTKCDVVSNNKVKKFIDDNINTLLSIDKLFSWKMFYDICNEENKNYIIDYVSLNFESLLNYYENIFYLKKSIIEIDKLKKKFDDYVNNNFKEVLAKILFKDDSFVISDDSYKKYIKDKSSVLEVLYLLFLEVCRNEKVIFSDINFIGEGAYSEVYGVGDKVIKLGRSRAIFNFPNNPYVIAPLLRRQIDIDGLVLKHIYVEVQEKVEILNPDEVDEEDLYQLYKNVRDLGLVWLDVDSENVGRLLKDNVIHWDSELLPTNSSLSFDGYRGDVTLKSGDLVILDGDYIFEEDKIPDKYNKENWGFYKQKEFESRYQKENRKK